MASSQTLITSDQTNNEKSTEDIPPETQFSKISTRNILCALGSRLFNLSQESTEVKKQEASPKNDKGSSANEKTKKEEKLTTKPTKVTRKLKSAGSTEGSKKEDKEFRRLKSKYNTGIGNIMRKWIGLVYCILILRMNLIKFIVEQVAQSEEEDLDLQDQLILESKTVYNMVRGAQNFSHERSVFLWRRLEALILSLASLKKSPEIVGKEDSMVRDWKGAVARLHQLTAQVQESKNSLKNIQNSNLQLENSNKENIAKLQQVADSKNEEIEHLVQQITEVKRKEIHYKKNFFLNRKACKDLKVKLHHLLNIEKELIALKSNQSSLLREYNNKILSLQSQIEEKEEQIKMEKMEKKKLKDDLAGIGDFSENESIAVLEV